MNFNPNGLFYKMFDIYKQNKREDNKIIICNEGGSRSSKTWDAFHLIIYFCNLNRNKNLDIYVLRDTLIHCRDFTLKDFIGVMTLCGIFDNSKLTTSPKPYYNLWGNNIYFRGLDDEKNTEGYPSDIVFVNEALETLQSKINGIKMRCRMFMIMDWNPKFTDHWCFDLEGQPDVYFTRSTYKNNTKLEKSVVAELESYCPWNFEDLELPEPQRRPHEENIKNKTANRFRWLVYGCGMRGAMEGVIFNDVKWIDSFPIEVERVFYGLDFGFTNDPSALVKCGINGKDLYLQGLLYKPTETVDVLDNYLKHILPKDGQCWADIADRGMVADLQRLGYQINAAAKWAGCIEHRVDIIKRHNIHIVKDSNFRKEQENYFFREINGIKLNTPDPNSKYCHYWDAVGYACQHELR